LVSRGFVCGKHCFDFSLLFSVYPCTPCTPCAIESRRVFSPNRDAETTMQAGVDVGQLVLGCRDEDYSSSLAATMHTMQQDNYIYGGRGTENNNYDSHARVDARAFAFTHQEKRKDGEGDVLCSCAEVTRHRDRVFRRFNFAFHDFVGSTLAHPAQADRPRHVALGPVTNQSTDRPCCSDEKTHKIKNRLVSCMCKSRRLHDRDLHKPRETQHTSL
jgi:hypothetical protein